MFSTSSQALGSYEAVCRRKQLEVLMGFIICFSSLHLLLLQGNEVFYSRFEE